MPCKGFDVGKDSEVDAPCEDLDVCAPCKYLDANAPCEDLDVGVLREGLDVGACKDLDIGTREGSAVGMCEDLDIGACEDSERARKDSDSLCKDVGTCGRSDIEVREESDSACEGSAVGVRQDLYAGKRADLDAANEWEELGACNDVESLREIRSCDDAGGRETACGREGGTARDTADIEWEDGE